MLSRQHRTWLWYRTVRGDTRRWPRRILKSEDRADIRFCIGTLPLNAAILRLITALIFALSGRKRYASNGGILDRASNRMRLSTTNRPNRFTHEYQRTLTSTPFSRSNSCRDSLRWDSVEQEGTRVCIVRPERYVKLFCTEWSQIDFKMTMLIPHWD